MPIYILGPLMVVTICCICWWSRSSTSVGPYIFSHLGRPRTQSPCRSGTIAKHLLSSLEHCYDPAIPGIPGPLQPHCTSLHQGRQEDHGPGVCGDGRGGGRGQRDPHHSHVRVGPPSSHQHLPVAGKVFNHGGDPGHQVSGEGSRVPSLPGLDRPSGAQL